MPSLWRTGTANGGQIVSGGAYDGTAGVVLRRELKLLRGLPTAEGNVPASFPAVNRLHRLLAVLEPGIVKINLATEGLGGHDSEA